MGCSFGWVRRCEARGTGSTRAQDSPTRGLHPMLNLSERYSALSLMATGTLVVVVLTLYLRHQLFGIGPIAIVLQVVAALLMLWARLVMRGRSFHAGAAPTEGELVTN